jgi:hypothetical protein
VTAENVFKVCDQVAQFALFQRFFAVFRLPVLLCMFVFDLLTLIRQPHPEAVTNMLKQVTSLE